MEVSDVVGVVDTLFNQLLFLLSGVDIIVSLDNIVVSAVAASADIDNLSLSK